MKTALIAASILLNMVLSRKWLMRGYYFLTKYAKHVTKKILMLAKIRNADAASIVNFPIVYQARQCTTEYLSEKKSVPAIPLPKKLIIEAACYVFAGKIYELGSEGLYRFMLPEKVNQQRIVFKRDIETLLSSIVWMRTHGEDHDHLTFNQLMHKAMNEKLILTCESVVNFAHELLTNLNIKARMVGTRALGKWNTYDSGHYLLEVYRDDLKQWVLYDIDVGVYFTKNKKLLSLIEFAALKNGDYDLQTIAASIPITVTPPDKQYNYTFLHEARLTHLKAWYERIMQLAFIVDKTKNVSFVKPSQFAKSYPKGIFPTIEYLDQAAFLHRYY